LAWIHTICEEISQLSEGCRRYGWYPKCDEPNMSLLALSYSPEDRRGAPGAVIQIVEGDSFATKREFSSADVVEVYCVCFSPDNTSIASGNKDVDMDNNTVRVWAIETGEILLRHSFGTKLIYHVSYNSLGTYLLCRTTDHVVVLCPVTGQMTFSVLASAASGAFLAKACFVSVSRVIAATRHWRNGCCMKCWESTSGQELYSVKFPDIKLLVASPSANAVAVSDLGGLVNIVDPNSGTITNYVRAGHSTHVSGMSFTLDGSKLATSSFNCKSIWIWDVATASFEQTIDMDTGIFTIEYLNYGRYLACACYGSWEVVVYDLEKKSIVHSFIDVCPRVICCSLDAVAILL
jgi:WD40 repeat protein